MQFVESFPFHKIMQSIMVDGGPLRLAFTSDRVELES